MGRKINWYISDKPGTFFRVLQVLTDFYRAVNTKKANNNNNNI